MDLSLLVVHIPFGSVLYFPLVVASTHGCGQSLLMVFLIVGFSSGLLFTLSAVKMVATQVQSRLHIQRREGIHLRSLPQTPALWILSPAGSFTTPEARCQVLGVIQSDADSQLQGTEWLDPGWVIHKCSTSPKSSNILSHTSHFASCLCLLAPWQGISTYWKLCKTYFYVWPE